MACIMTFDEDDFSKTITNFGKFVMQILSGTNGKQKKLLKVNLQAFQNLCESLEMLHQNDFKQSESEITGNDFEIMSIDDSEIKIEKRQLDIRHEAGNIKSDEKSVKIVQEKEVNQIKTAAKNSTNVKHEKVTETPRNVLPNSVGNKKEVPKEVVNKRKVHKRNSKNSKDDKKIKLDPDRKVQLPDEIWMKIMSYLKSTFVFQNVSLVCKRFLKIHRNAVKYLEMKNVGNIKNCKKGVGHKEKTTNQRKLRQNDDAET